MLQHAHQLGRNIATKDMTKMSCKADSVLRMVLGRSVAATKDVEKLSCKVDYALCMVLR